MATSRSTEPSRSPSAATAPVSWSGSRQSSIRQCAGDRGADVFGERRRPGRCSPDPTRAPGTAHTAPTNRVVASSAYGATNTTFAMLAGPASPGRAATLSSSPSCTWSLYPSRASRTTRSSSSRALHDVGATVIGIGERPKDWLDGDVAGWLSHYEQVPSVVDEGRLHEVVRGLQQHLEIHRLEATVEAHVMAAARVREACGIPGTSERTAFLCRDKPAMKDVLRQAGIRCAASTAARSGDDVRRFASEVGYPLVLKPAAGAGASGAERVNAPDELSEAIARSGVDHGAEIAVEEFVEGHEGFYDTISIDGTVAMEFATHYYPNVLEAMRTRWISPQFVATNRIDGEPGYDEVKEMGRDVIAALGIGTSATHMEWFAGPKGLYFSEIGCRPPGVRCWDLYAAGNDIDIYREWAMAVVHGHLAQAPSRRFAAGHRRPAARPRRHDHGLRGGRRHPAPPRRVGHRRPPAAAGHADPAGRGRVHGQRLGTHAPPRLRRPARDARRRRAHREGARLTTPTAIERVAPSGDLTSDVLETSGRRGRLVPDRRRRRLHVRLSRPVISVRLIHFGVGFPGDLDFEQLGDSEWWLLALDVPRGSRLEYKLEVTDSFGTTVVEDPLNGRHASAPLRRQFGVRGRRLRRTAMGA